MADSLGHKATTGAIWASIDKFGSMSLQFVVNLILARLLMPSDFGAIGMLTIFIAVSQVLIDSGFGSALIQKKNPTQTDYSTIFYWNVGFSLFLYAILFICSPVISKFYNMPILSDVLRAIGIILIINGVLSIQRTRLQKTLSFKLIAITNLGSYIIGSSIAIGMAYCGLGVWSLVIMQLLCGSFSVLILWFITHWHPSLVFSKNSMKELFGFGGYIMAANILQTICQNLQGIIIGKQFSAVQMGYYSQAHKLDQISSYSIPQVIVQVMYPVYSSIQDDKNHLNNVLAMNIRVISFIIFPIITLLILVAVPLIDLLYGEKWIPCASYFQILCIGGYFVCLQNINFYAVAAVGKSKTLFLWSFYKWGFLLAALISGMLFGMSGILWGMVISSINIFLVNAYLVGKHVGLQILSQFKLLAPIVIIITVTLIATLICTPYLSPILESILFIFLFLGLSYLFRLKALTETKILILKLINK